MVESQRKRAGVVERSAETHAPVECEAIAPLEQQPDQLQEILVPAHRDAVLGDPAKTCHQAIAQRFHQRIDVAHSFECNAVAGDGDPGQRRRERLDLESIDADDRVAVIDEVMGERESCRPQPDDQHPPAGTRSRHRPAQTERIPSREKRVDLEAPRQRQHIFQHAGFRLRNVDRILLLVDARFHAVVADTMTGRGNHRIVDADHCQRAQWNAFGTQLVELRNALVQRAAGKRHVERRFLERNVAVRGLLVGQSARTRILGLFMAPDAVVRLIETAGEIHAGVGERKPVPLAQRVAGRQLPG